MREICGNTRSVHHIVKTELIDQRAGFQEQRKRLSRRKVNQRIIQEIDNGIEDRFLPGRYHQQLRERLRVCYVSSCMATTNSEREKPTCFNHDEGV